MSPENIAFLADNDNALRLAHWIVHRTAVVGGKLVLTHGMATDNYDGNIDVDLYAQLEDLTANAPPPPPNKFTTALIAYRLDPKPKRFAEVVKLGQSQGMSLENIFTRMTDE